MPLNTHRLPSGEWQYVLPADTTALMRCAVVALLSTAEDLNARDFTARCTRAGGAMAMLFGGLEANNRIRFVGRWRLDEVYRYLHVQDQPVMAGVAATMLGDGDFRLNLLSFPPGAVGGPPFPDPLAPLANEVPAPIHE